MKVKELIEILKNKNPEAEIFCYSDLEDINRPLFIFEEDGKIVLGPSEEEEEDE